MQKIRFGIVGAAGWRAQFFLRIAAADSQRFEVLGAVVRDPAKAADQQRTWGVRTFADLDAMLDAAAPPFVVVSVKRGSAPEVLRRLAARGVPALCETPPAEDVQTMAELHGLVERGARIQVAEQYVFQPHHAARLAVARSGRLGTVTQAQVSACHGYHGMSLVRNFLGVGFALPKVSAFRFRSPIVAGPGRSGPPQGETIRESVQTIAHLDFGDRLGVHDFTGDQYFSHVRSQRLLVRGERGEINGSTVRWLDGPHSPVEVELRRVDAGHEGNLEGYYHKGILAGSEWVYRNRFTPARLSDEEIAIATCLEKMQQHVAGGDEFYPLAEAAQDWYLDSLIAQAADTGQAVQAQRQPWMA